jgi:hypothetical protein
MNQKVGTWEVFHYPEPEGRWDWECSECGSLQTFRTRHCEIRVNNDMSQESKNETHR